MIEITDLSFAYVNNAPPVLDRINLTIQEDEWVAVLGCNGSGKSTLARHLNGLLLPNSGQVKVDGLNTLNPEQLFQIREKVAFVFQNPDNQFIASSVEDDIAFGLENLGLPQQEIVRRVDQAVELIGLESMRSKEPHLLSGGEKQRVALAGALAMASSYLVLDEPTSMLDPAMRHTIIEALHLLHEEAGMAIIYVTNIMEEVLLADRAIVLDQGVIAKDCTPRELFSDPAWLAERQLDMPQICQLASMLVASGYSQFENVIYPEELMEKLLCGK